MIKVYNEEGAEHSCLPLEGDKENIAPTCPICFEEYSDSASDRRPLILACCKASTVCRGCIAHLVDRGFKKCFYCDIRPSSRFFIDNCEAFTESDHIDKLRKQLEEAVRVRIPQPLKLGSGVLADELLALSERPGDAKIARELEQQFIQEYEKEKILKEQKDFELAQRLQSKSSTSSMSSTNIKSKINREKNNILDIRQAFLKKARSSSQSPIKEKWSCASCTFQNHPLLQACEACDNKRIPQT